ncbi:unnamed protein product [Oncorhynchus mykiss]|uniref:COP9 signalosome complex subunit 9 n=1 Tax=Oncorhynchus mykiss TaxID=8022 RepID=A0A060YC99_ONCMY|nr:unnamed protein product [Oncorhynchus mykiss]
MKPAVDEMFPEGAGPYVDLDEAGGSSGLLMELAANEKAVHSDFFNEGEKEKEERRMIKGFMVPVRLKPSRTPSQPAALNTLKHTTHHTHTTRKTHSPVFLWCQ